MKTIAKFETNSQNKKNNIFVSRTATRRDGAVPGQKTGSNLELKILTRHVTKPI